jgi:hypothetical protein
MVAFSASRLAWSAIPEMIRMTSPTAADAWPSASTSLVIVDASPTALAATRPASPAASRSRETVSSRACAPAASSAKRRSTSSLLAAATDIDEDLRRRG